MRRMPTAWSEALAGSSREELEGQTAFLALEGIKE